jgi:hypothetical protein
MKHYILSAVIVLFAFIILFTSCSMKPTIILTIYNNTNITEGELHLIYGNYQGYMQMTNNTLIM